MAKLAGDPAFPAYILLSFVILALLSSIIASINAAFFIMPNHAVRTAPFNATYPGLDAAGYIHARRSFFASGLSGIAGGMAAIVTVFIALKRGGRKV
jgi:hypothetical protein